MLNLGFSEIVVIAVLAIVVIGPDRLPEVMRFLGRQYGKAMRASNELRRTFLLEADRVEAEERAAELRRRRDEARRRAEDPAARGLPAPSPPAARPEGVFPRTGPIDAGPEPVASEPGNPDPRTEG